MIHPPEGGFVVEKTDKAHMTVEEFARVVGVKPERLTSQLKEAGINIDKASGRITEEQKQKLLR